MDGSPRLTGATRSILSDLPSNYLATIPVDPKTGTDVATDYYLSIDANGSVIVGSCAPEAEGPGGNGDVPII